MMLTPPQVGRLLARPRKWAWIHVRAGEFGAAVQAFDMPGRPWLVELAAVERYAARTFASPQIAAAMNPGVQTTADQSRDDA